MRYHATYEDVNHKCCYNAVVVDSQEPDKYNNTGFQMICECFDMETAKKIADALNHMEPTE